MRCSKCGMEINPEEAVKDGNMVLCEDCYFDEIDRVRTCDPWAVMLAKKANTGKLTQRQQAIYDLVKRKGKVRIEDVARELGIRTADVEREFAVLRHLELVKARREGNDIFIVPFDS